MIWILVGLVFVAFLFALCRLWCLAQIADDYTAESEQ